MKNIMDFGYRAAGEYLQSAVFIDDEIFSAESGKAFEKLELVSPRTRKPTFSKEPAGPQGTVEESVEKVADVLMTRKNEGKPESFHPKEIVASFARQGIVCALYEPAPDFKTDKDSEIFKICQAADLVVLDWDFHKDDGAKMRDLVTDLVTQSSKIVPHHSRLVVIYTTTPSLQKVGSSLYDKLKGAGMEPAPKDNGLRQDIEATRIVILGKPSVQRTVDETKFTVEEKNLAARVIEEFVLKNLGILSSSALIAMGAIKRNSRRVLAKFSPEMDGAFLLHRAFLLHTDDAFESLPSLIAEELQAVIEDHFAGIGGLVSVAENRIGNLTLKLPDNSWSMDAGKNENGKPVTKPLGEMEFHAITRAFLNKGVPGLKDYRTCGEVRKLSEDARNISRPPDQSVLRVLREAVDHAGAKTNEKLAALFNARTYYEQQIRYLSLGTVVRTVNNEKEEYSLCIIPICDSVRLPDNKAVDFHFLRLVEGNFGSRGGNGCVIEDPNGKLIQLVAAPKVRNLHIERFTAIGGIARAELEKGSGKYSIKSEAGRNFDWVGQLKPAHAQRIAHTFGQSLSRVGLSEAEWVRLLCDKV